MDEGMRYALSVLEKNRGIRVEDIPTSGWAVVRSNALLGRVDEVIVVYRSEASATDDARLRTGEWGSAGWEYRVVEIVREQSHG
jgi:hypothetical protein